LCGYITVGVRSDVPLPLRVHAAIAAVFATGQWLCRIIDKVSMLQPVNVMFHFFV